MSRFHFRPQALDDLQALLTHIAEDSPNAAHRIHDNIIKTCTTLGENPLIAIELEGLSINGVRRIPVSNYPRYVFFIGSLIVILKSYELDLVDGTGNI